MDPALKPVRSEDLNWCSRGADGILMDPDTGEVWSLNPVGLFIWDHCDGEHNIDQISVDLMHFFGVEASVAQQDLESFLLTMEDRGLVRLGFTPAC